MCIRDRTSAERNLYIVAPPCVYRGQNMMTRQHYIKVAEIIKAFPHGSTGASASKLAQEFAEMFGEDNPRFDRERFYIACGL